MENNVNNSKFSKFSNSNANKNLNKEINHGNKLSDIEQLQVQADSGNAEAQYNLSVHYLNSDKPEDIQLAYKYCFMAVQNGFDYAAHNLGLMYRNGSTPVWDLIASEYLLDIATKTNVPNAEQALAEVQESVDSYSTSVRINPQLPLGQVPCIKGVKASLDQFLNLLNDQKDTICALCGRIGSISSYPMIELRRSSSFKSVAGMNLMENPSDGLCLIVTFVQISEQPTQASVEEAFGHRRFKELEFFNEFTCHMSYNIASSDNTISDVWEYTQDCGRDTEKAEKIASSILYHLYGYKKNLIYPAVRLDIMSVDGNILVMPDDQNDSTGLLYFGIEQFGWPDAVILALVWGLCLYFADSIGLGIFFGMIGTFCALTYGFLLTSHLKTVKFPKRNYIRFLRNPNATY